MSNSFEFISDHDDIHNDIENKDNAYYQFIGFMAGDGISFTKQNRLGISQSSIHCLDLIDLLGSIGVNNPSLS